MDRTYDYNLWFLVIVNSLVFIIFAAGFFRPKTGIDNGTTLLLHLVVSQIRTKGGVLWQIKKI